MELLQLKYFKAAAELENFSAVAEKYYVPQPSISATIKKLETELGVQLFDRNGKRITLNSNGKIFYEKIASAYNIEVDQVKASIDASAIAEDMKVQKAMTLVKDNANITVKAAE